MAEWITWFDAASASPWGPMIFFGVALLASWLITELWP